MRPLAPFPRSELSKWSANISIRIAPYILARTWSSLDHITRGRIGWNVVTSYSESAAKAMGKDRVPPSHERYEAAEEFLDITYQYVEFLSHSFIYVLSH